MQEASSQHTGATRLTRPLALLVCLASLHTALLVTSMVAGAKLVALPFHLSASATVLSYTLTFVILDTLAELYGPAVSRFVITMGLVAMILAAVYMEVAALLPGPPGIVSQDAYAAVLSNSWRIWLAGWIAYTISQRLDVWSFLLLKRVGGIGASVAARAWFSLIFGQLIDTALFITIAFAGTTCASARDRRSIRREDRDLDGDDPAGVPGRRAGTALHHTRRTRGRRPGPGNSVMSAARPRRRRDP